MTKQLCCLLIGKKKQTKQNKTKQNKKTKNKNKTIFYLPTPKIYMPPFFKTARNTNMLTVYF